MLYFFLPVAAFLHTSVDWKLWLLVSTSPSLYSQSSTFYVHIYFILDQQTGFCDCAIVVITVSKSLEYGLYLRIYNNFRVYLNLYLLTYLVF